MPLFRQLPAHVESRILGLLTPNEIACTVRGLSKEYAAQWRSCVVVRLSGAVPQHAFTRQWGVGSPALRLLTLEKRWVLLRLTASSGVLENLVLALDSAGCLLTAKLALMEAAAGAGHLHVCLWLRDRGLPWGAALNTAAGAGRRNVCEQLLSLGCVPTMEAAAEAARRGHAGLMDWLLALLPEGRDHPNRAPRVILAAASGCDLATMQRLLTVWLPAALQGGAAGGDAVEPREVLNVANQLSCVAAAARGHAPDWRNKVEWLEGLFRNPWRPECSEVAGLPDAIERLAWLRGRGYPLGEESVNEAAWTGNTATLTYLLGEVGVKVAAFTPTWRAARIGHLAALQLLVARGCPVGASSAICQAAWYGHLAVVAWLVEELGVDVSELGSEVKYAAAASGSVELLVWLRERGCPWTDDTFRGAAWAGCEAVLEWLVERGCPLADGAYCYDSASWDSDLAMVRCLRRLGVRWGSGDTISSEAVVEAPFAMLRWLVETAGVPVDWEAALEAVETGIRLDKEEDKAVRDQRPRDREAVRDWLREGKRRQEGVQPGP